MTPLCQFFRITVERPGRLTRGGDAAECMVLDMTEKGFQLRTDLAIAVGEMVHLDCELDEHHPLHCALVITYVSAPYVGGRILSLSTEDKRHLTQVIEHSILSKLVGM